MKDLIMQMDKLILEKQRESIKGTLSIFEAERGIDFRSQVKVKERGKEYGRYSTNCKNGR